MKRDELFLAINGVDDCLIAGCASYSAKNKVVKLKGMNRGIVAVACLCMVLILSGTAYAAWKYLSAKDVASKIGDTKLTEAFDEQGDWAGGETQSCGGYDIAMIGLISGKELSDYLVTSDGQVVSDNTYAVVGISKTDGSAMPDVSSDSYGDNDFLVSPYIQGYNPSKYNIFTLAAGGYFAVVEDGIQYRIMEVENIEAFADREIYLGVSDGSFYNSDAYIYDNATGKISRNEKYDGVNALFVLPMDPSKADKRAADAIIEKVENPIEEDIQDLPSDKEVETFISKLTVDNIDNYATPVESTRKNVTPDKDGYISYDYVMPNGTSSSGFWNIEDMFPDGKIGMSENFSYSSSENGIKDLVIETYTLNKDGTVTCVAYVPKNH